MSDALWSQISPLLVAAALVTPGLVALYLSLRQDSEEKLMRLQVKTLADEVQRLQVLVDDKARELGQIELELKRMRAAQKVLIEYVKRLSVQVKQLGGVPVVDGDNIESIVS